MPDWIGANVRMFRLHGWVARLVQANNLKSGVNKASLYDLEINRSSSRIAACYGVGVVPARLPRPKHKAEVEAAARFA